MFLLLLACAPKAAPVPSQPLGPPTLVDAALLAIVTDGFTPAKGWTLAPLVQLDRADTHALIVWPMFDPSGRVVDDDVVGVTILADGVLGAMNWRPDSRRLAVELGGDDWTIRFRDVGLAQDALGDALVARTEAFVAARDATDGAAAIHAVQDLSRLFALESILDQTVTNLLAQAGEVRYVSRKPGSRTAVFTFEVDGRSLELQAAQMADDYARWQYVSDR